MNWKAGQFAKRSKCQITNLQNLQNVLFTKILFNCQVCSNSYWKGKIFVTTFEDFCSFIGLGFTRCFINLLQLDKTEVGKGTQRKGEFEASESWSSGFRQLYCYLCFPSTLLLPPTPFTCMINMAVQRGLEGDVGAQTQEQKLVKRAEEEGKVFVPKD